MITQSKKPLLLQLSIPFCVRQCSYCSYPFCAYDPQVVRAYARALWEEIESCAGEYDDYEIRAISIEGGSPALLGADELAGALLRVRRAFSCAASMQISLQTMPGQYSRALMEKMRDAGVNFWIIGLETTQMEEHEQLNRPYRFDAITMVDMAVRTFSPRSLSFDLLAGIPGQTEASLEKSMRRCLYYAPEHMTIYPLQSREAQPTQEPASHKATDNGSSKQAKPAQEPASHKATGNGSALQAQHAQELASFAAQFLADHGFTRYTLYDYGRDGCRNQFRLQKLQGCEYLGLGYHGQSFMDGVMWKTGRSLQEYLDHPADFAANATNIVRPDEQSLQRIHQMNQNMLVIM
ncbi:MAG: radical SAM protein [Lachnospiraceae bacterium]|nr:radical SAM protein [Lachnospiraceae bacterium]